MKKLLLYIVSLLLLFASCNKSNPPVVSHEEKEQQPVDFTELKDSMLYRQVLSLSKHDDDDYDIKDNHIYVSNDSLYCSRIKLQSRTQNKYKYVDYIYIKILYPSKVHERVFFQNPKEYGMKDLLKFGEDEFFKVYGSVEKSIEQWEKKHNRPYKKVEFSREEKLYHILYLRSLGRGELVREYKL